MDKEFQKRACLFHFIEVRAAHQPYLNCFVLLYANINSKSQETAQVQKILINCSKQKLLFEIEIFNGLTTEAAVQSLQSKALAAEARGCNALLKTAFLTRRKDQLNAEVATYIRSWCNTMDSFGKFCLKTGV